jgi:hypothetical protein
MWYRPLSMALLVLMIACLDGTLSSAHAQGGGCTPGAVEADLAGTVTSLTQSVQPADEARGTIETVADAVRQNDVRLVCLNAPGSDNPTIDGLIQSQMQAFDAFNTLAANNPTLSSFLAQNNIDVGRVVIVGADTSMRPIRLYVWNRR